MKICFIADLRSSIARSWISHFVVRHEVHVLSTLPAPPLDGVRIHSLTEGREDEQWRRRKSDWSRFLDPMSWPGRAVSHAHDQLWQPVKARGLAPRARRLLRRIAPDLIHSLRIPIEGEIGALVATAPHVVSAWGNDFTLYADRSALHRQLTVRALRTCAGFLADAGADLDRAAALGLPAWVPRQVLPGAGGIRTEIFPGPASGRGTWAGDLAPLAALDPAVPVVVNPRGFRRYVRNDTFFEAARLVALGDARVRFVGVGMKGWQPIETLARATGLADRILLTGPLSQRELAALYARATVSVSPTEHDGTPNSLLEAMACGCFPVCGSLPSIREWIEDGVNGLLVRPDRPMELAAAVRRALADPVLRNEAAAMNRQRVDARAEYGKCMAAADEFYETVAGGGGVGRPEAGRSAAVCEEGVRA